MSDFAHDAAHSNPSRAKRFYPPRHWTLAQRLACYSAAPDERGCVIWTGSRGSHGYGQLKWRGRVLRTHRLSWELANGPIPSGMFVCHKCDVRACINPAHLFLGTDLDNIADKVAKGRQAAPRGEANRSAKLSAKQALEIFAATGSRRDIAARYGVGFEQVGRIKRRVYWRHIHGGEDV